MLSATKLKLPTHFIAAGLVKHAVSLTQAANDCFVAGFDADRRRVARRFRNGYGRRYRTGNETPRVPGTQTATGRMMRSNRSDARIVVNQRCTEAHD